MREGPRTYAKRQGRPVSVGLLQDLSPLGWQHINLTGDYLWTEPVIGPGQLRTLRQVLGPPDPRSA